MNLNHNFEYLLLLLISMLLKLVLFYCMFVCVYLYNIHLYIIFYNSFIFHAIHPKGLLIEKMTSQGWPLGKSVEHFFFFDD